jgi:hypothetical protein
MVFCDVSSRAGTAWADSCGKKPDFLLGRVNPVESNVTMTFPILTTLITSTALPALPRVIGKENPTVTLTLGLVDRKETTTAAKVAAALIH